MVKKKLRIKKLNILSIAKIQSILMAFMGLFMGVVDIFFGGSAFEGYIPTYLVPIVMLLFYGIFGFIFGIVSAYLYNIFSRMIGPIEIEYG